MTEEQIIEAVAEAWADITGYEDEYAVGGELKTLCKFQARNMVNALKARGLLVVQAEPSEEMVPRGNGRA